MDPTPSAPQVEKEEDHHDEIGDDDEARSIKELSLYTNSKDTESLSSDTSNDVEARTSEKLVTM